MKLKLNYIYSLFCVILVGSLFINSSDGRDDNLSGAPSDFGTCANCHGGGGGTGSVSLNNTPTSIQAGQTYALTLSVSHSSAIKAGFQIVATNGTTNTMIGSFAASSGTRVNSNNRLTQSTPKALSGGSTSWTFNWTAPSSNLPSNIKFFYVCNAVNDNGDTSGDEVYSSSKTVSTTIPVELVSFEAKNNTNKAVTLVWSTASEKDNSAFIVEKSDVDQKFESIGQLKGNGTSNKINRYQFTDNQINTSAKIAYYRLRQVDINGETTYSKTLSVELSKQNTLKIYPSVVNKGDILNIEKDDNTHIDIIDINGKVMKTLRQTINDSVQNVATETIKIPTADLPLGRYFVRSNYKNAVQTTGFMVIN